MEKVVLIKHGTLNAYAYHKCKCDLCRQANRTYKAKYELGRKIRKMVLARQAREHAKFLLMNGHSLRSLAAQVGVDPETIADVVDQKRKHVTVRVRDRLLSGHLENAPFKTRRKCGAGVAWDRKHRKIA